MNDREFKGHVWVGCMRPREGDRPGDNKPAVPMMELWVSDEHETLEEIERALSAAGFRRHLDERQNG